MGMSREEKAVEVGDLNDRFASDALVVVAHYKGLSVKAITELRAKMRAEGGRFKVTKNTLAKIAVQGTPCEAMSDMFTGPTGVASSADPVVAAKVAQNFAKENDAFQIIGGVLNGVVLDAAAVKNLASLPSLDELRSKIVGLLQAPATKLAGLLQAPARDLVGVTKAYGEKA